MPRRFATKVRRRRRPWANTPLLAKSLLVGSVPVLALVVCSGLVLSSDSSRGQAQRNLQAAQALNGAANQVRSTSTAAIADLTKYFIVPGPASISAVHSDLSAWGTAMAAVETATRGQGDVVLAAEAGHLHAASDAFYAIVERLSTIASGSEANTLFTEAVPVNSTFESAVNAVSAHAEAIATTNQRAYGRLSARTTALVILTGGLGAGVTLLAMVAFAISIRRQLRRLEVRAQALAWGHPSPEADHSCDEIGRLGSCLDQAGTVLARRERDLNDTADAVRESQSKLAMALDSGAMGIWDVDLDTGTAVWDEQCEADHGLGSGSFDGTFEAWLALVHPEDRGEVFASASSAMAEGGRWTTSYRTLLADGSVRWIGSSGLAIGNEEGRTVRLIGISSDITIRKQDEQQLHDAIEAAEQANDAKNEFLSRVSHELRTPLNAILGFGQLMAMDELSDSHRESVEHVLGAGRHLLALIEDVLAISRIESGNMTLSVEPVNLSEVVAEVVALVSPTAQQNGVALNVRAEDCAAVYVRADRRHLKQILVNLASNAVKFNHRDGTVTFICTPVAGGTVRVAVADTGKGIPSDRLDRLFTPFDRLGAEQLDVEGTGIGLALSQHLAELHGTTLTVESEEGRGSTFTLDLQMAEDPLTPDPATAVPYPPAAEPVPDGTVLYVEDNPSNLRLVQRVLDRRGGIRLLSAGTGAIALAMADTIPIDVVLLDLHLPDMTGEDVLAGLRNLAATATTPVIVVSADVSPGQIDRLYAAGANSFLSKPIDVAELLHVLEDRLAKAPL